MSYEEETPNRPARKLVHQRRAEARAAQQMLVEDIVSRGEIDGETKMDAIQAAINYYNELKEHRDERAIRDRWDETGIGSLEAYLFQKTTVERPAPGDTSATRTERVPAVHALEAEELNRIFDELNELAKELGFGPRVDQPTPRDDAEMGDVSAFMEARGQEGPLDRMPSTDTE